MMDRPFEHLGGEALRRKAKSAEVAFSHELARLRAHDEQFRASLDLTMALDDEIERRRNR